MIIFPMAGMSSRFRKAGYTMPKYMLEVGKESVFSLAVRSFSDVFETEDFLFVVGEGSGIKEFVNQQIELLGIKSFEIVSTLGPTEGQADTVDFALGHCGFISDVIIFNIDTFRRQIFPKDFSQKSDGYLEVFKGQGNSWSFVLPGAENQVLQTTEKVPISDLCSTGLYYFLNSDIFRYALNKERQNRQATELYVAPLYNHLIDDGLDVRFHEVPLEDVVFCGVPLEYQEINSKIQKGFPIFS